MRIGIEAQRIWRKKKHGMDMMAIELIKNLQKLDKSNEYFIFVNPDEDTKVIQPQPNFTIVPLSKSPYPIWEQFFLPKAVKEYQLDLLHCTSNTAPIKLNVPLILTLHDIIYLERFEWKSGSSYQRLGNFYRRWNVPLIVNKAARILTVSKYEEKRIKKHFKFQEGKIEVVYNGIGKHFTPAENFQTKTIRQEYGLPDRYALFLGNTDPKKNLIGLIKAFKILCDRNELDIELVITDLSEETLMGFLKELDAETLRERIYLPGYVRNQELPIYYRNAEFFLYISLRESFGLPILEAMACGCPVITSNTSSMPEIAGDAAMLVNPTDSEAISEMINQLSRDAQKRQQLKAKGLQRPLQFSYITRVKRILKIYHEIHQKAHE